MGPGREQVKGLIFAGRRRPTFGTLPALCHALELALEDVLKFNVDAVHVTIP
jgi:DNA-binding Xre family transcriptional regulator